MTSISQHIPQSPDNQETSPEEKSQASLTAQGVTRRPIWEVIVEIGEQIPDEEWVKVPADASTNYKHYLYGTPEREKLWPMTSTFNKQASFPCCAPEEAPASSD